MYLPVLGTPALHKTHSNGTHSCQLIDSFKTLTDGLRKQCCKLLVVEDFQVTAYGQDLHKTRSCNYFQDTVLKLQKKIYLHLLQYSLFLVYAEAVEYQ
jgi:hypothetical protein